MPSIQQRVQAVRSRQQRQWLWQCISWGLVAGGLCGLALAAIRIGTGGTLAWLWLAAGVLAGPILGSLWALLRPRGASEAATLIDRACGMKDRVTTALYFMRRGSNSAIQQLQISDTERRISTVDPIAVAPIATPRTWIAGLVLTFLAVVLGLFSGKSNEAVANVMKNDVVVAQALRFQESLEQLQEFQEEQLDPEVEELLKELSAQIQQLKQPGIDPKEALAKLSEMETALHQQQQQLSQENTEATLQEVGEALSLAEPFQAAGQALAQGEMDEAAEELAQMEMEELDRQTERSVTEKLEQAESNSSGNAKKQLKQAISQLAQGIGQGDRSKFKDGVQGLAGECKKQGRRKKLMDLLRKQCQCLSECKGECESECKNTADSKKKGGKNWGLGASGNEAGDKTSMLKSSDRLEITGQESDSGDIDVETTASEQQQQEAVRQYRQQAEKYEQLSESVLSSEPIPLGHRQTIRKYFELIRPQSAETDAVNEQLDTLEQN